MGQNLVVSYLRREGEGKQNGWSKQMVSSDLAKKQLQVCEPRTSLLCIQAFVLPKTVLLKITCESCKAKTMNLHHLFLYKYGHKYLFSQHLLSSQKAAKCYV